MQPSTCPSCSDLYLCGRHAASFTGLRYPGAFNKARAKMEQYEDESGALRPLPDFAATHRDPKKRKAAERAFRDSHVLRVPVWGAVKWIGAEWRYRRTTLQAL